MGAYAATVTLDHRSAAKFGNGGYKFLSGQVAVTNYNQTLAEITGISNQFKSVRRVVCDNVSSTGYLCRWVPASKSLKFFYPTAASDQTPTADIPAGPATEVASDTDVGIVNFFAFGV